MGKGAASEKRFDDFAKAFVETRCAVKAREMAGYSMRMSKNAQYVDANRLLNHPKIALRIAKLEKQHAERHEITVDTITEMLKEDRAFAKDNGQSGPAVTATMGLAKIHGLVIDKVKGDPNAPLMVNQVIMQVVDPHGDDEGVEALKPILKRYRKMIYIRKLGRNAGPPFYDFLCDIETSPEFFAEQRRKRDALAYRVRDNAIEQVGKTNSLVALAERPHKGKRAKAGRVG